MPQSPVSATSSSQAGQASPCPDQLDPRTPLKPAPPSPSVKLQWLRLFFMTLLALQGYLLLEWLFFITKPSFMSTLGAGGRLIVLLNSALIPLAPILWGFGIASLLAWSLSSCRAVFLRLAALAPALILSVLLLLLIDNFTYTIFRFGIIKSTGVGRVIYAAVFLILAGWSYRMILRRAVRPGPLEFRTEARALGFGLGLLLLPAIVSSVLFGDHLSGKDLLDIQLKAGAPERRPNIIIFVSDGLNAENLSLYGYRRETTPFLDKLQKDCLIAENVFNNGASSGASIASMLGGRLPTENHMVYPPDILHGEDAFRNFPAILKKLGYTCVDISTRYYADAPDLNILNGFDEANFRSLRKSAVREWVEQWTGSDASYFISCLEERATQRLSHIFFLRSMDDPYNEVQADNSGALQNDPRRVEGALDAIRNTKTPLFLHLHLNTTHGPMFFPREQYFTKGMTQFRDWMADFYDDGIRSVDQDFQRVYDLLQQTGKLENTILIFTTDHSQHAANTPIQDYTTHRLPMVFHFPGGEHAGRISSNTQLLDIAPTVLDYLNVDNPAWMGGTSLIGGPPDPQRPIFSATWNADLNMIHEGVWVHKPNAAKPPFYHFGGAYVILRHMWYGLDMANLQFDYGDIAKHTAPCKPEELPKPDAVFNMLLDHLEKNGFDLSTVKDKIKRPEIARPVVDENVADEMKRTTNIPDYRKKCDMLQLYTSDTIQIRFPVDDPEKGDFIAVESEHKLIPGQDYIVTCEILDPYEPANQGGIFQQQVFFNGKPIWTHDISGNADFGWKPLRFEYRASGDRLTIQFKELTLGQPQQGWKWGAAASLAIRNVEVVPAGEKTALPR